MSKYKVIDNENRNEIYSGDSMSNIKDILNTFPEYLLCDGNGNTLDKEKELKEEVLNDRRRKNKKNNKQDLNESVSLEEVSTVTEEKQKPKEEKKKTYTLLKDSKVRIKPDEKSRAVLYRELDNSEKELSKYSFPDTIAIFRAGSEVKVLDEYGKDDDSWVMCNSGWISL